MKSKTIRLCVFASIAASSSSAFAGGYQFTCEGNYHFEKKVELPMPGGPLESNGVVEMVRGGVLIPNQSDSETGWKASGKVLLTIKADNKNDQTFGLSFQSTAKVSADFFNFILSARPPEFEVMGTQYIQLDVQNEAGKALGLLTVYSSSLTEVPRVYFFNLYKAHFVTNLSDLWSPCQVTKAADPIVQ